MGFGIELSAVLSILTTAGVLIAAVAGVFGLRRRHELPTIVATMKPLESRVAGLDTQMTLVSFEQTQSSTTWLISSVHVPLDFRSAFSKFKPNEIDELGRVVRHDYRQTETWRRKIKYEPPIGNCQFLYVMRKTMKSPSYVQFRCRVKLRNNQLVTRGMFVIPNV